ncbi:MAG: helix-turn-helix domain-containing protein, partial [Acidimicrobiia bacterium]
MNLKTASRELEVHYQTAYKWVRSGLLPAIRVGGRYEVSEDAIDQFRATRRSLASVPTDPGLTPLDANPSREDVLEELEAMATDPVISSPSVVTFAARRGHDVVGDGCMVVIMNEDGSRVDYSALNHDSPARLAILTAALGLIGPAPVMGCNSVSQAYFFDRTVRVPHVPQDAMRIALVPELRQHLVQYPVHSLMSTPLSVAGRPVGFVAFARDSATQPYTEADEAYVVRFANRVGALLQIVRDTTAAWRVRAELVDELRAKMVE